VKHFRHQDRLSGEDEYYLTTLESIAEFINGISHKDLKIDEKEYQNMIKSAQGGIEKDKRDKEEAAQQELTDLLCMNETASTIPKEEKKGKTPEKKEKLDKLDKVYNEMKQKNKKLKKELQDQKSQNEQLRSIFAEF
jgi:hypothetical protein